MTTAHGLARSTALATLMATLLIVALPGVPAGAAEPPYQPSATHVDKWGPHALIDEFGTQAGAWCLHGSGANLLERIRVRAPLLLAHRSRRQQTVGWRVRIHEWDGGSWVEVRKNGYRKATATRTRAADLSARTLDVAAFVSPPFPMAVEVQMAWYAGDGKTVTGRASHWVASYESIVEGIGSAGFNFPCPAIPG